MIEDSQNWLFANRLRMHSGEISDHLPHFHTLRYDSHLMQACRIVLRHIGASNNFVNKSSRTKTSKSDPSSIKHSLSFDTNITSDNHLGAVPITISCVYTEQFL